jgi:hypothetical protein
LAAVYHVLTVVNSCTLYIYALRANLSTHKALTANLIIDSCPLGTRFFVSFVNFTAHVLHTSCRLGRRTRSEELRLVLRRGEARLEKSGNTSQLHHPTSLVTVA